ncbi:hypothetical protein J2X01_001204 [Arthrobacter ginsengisoli]|uniref:Uncharacterized protein n=1 Tax=Arthrobacter ginsengisoli TaxID=1356565 RepID=A0ABU1U9T2_9MICC|nr:hypothetical protein [Arthrobacter ginsengisoli]
MNQIAGIATLALQQQLSITCCCCRGNGVRGAHLAVILARTTEEHLT